MTKKKTKENPNLLREPKAKKKLGLSVPKIAMPHEELFQKNVIPFEGSETLSPLDSQTTTFLDSQTILNEISNTIDIGYPTPENLDIQTINTGIAKINSNGLPNELKPDSQIINNGYPKPENLDSLISKEPDRISKETKLLDIQTSKKKNLDIQKTKVETEKGKWKKYERSRNRKGIFLRTDDELTKQFKQFCIQHDLEFAQGTELAWQKFMESLDSQKGKGLDSLIATNNLITSLSKTKPFIINLYLTYNKIFNSETKWKTSDDKVGQIFNNADIRLIEIGIIQTQGELYQQLENGKYGKKDPTKIINAFSYYRQKIESNIQFFEGNEQMIAYLLESSRAKHKKWTGKEIDLAFLGEGK